MSTFKTLPLGSTINNCQIFHEGNHNENGNPHKQYLSSANWHRTLNNGSLVDKCMKIIEVDYLGDNNYSMMYEIDFNVNTHSQPYKMIFKIQNGTVQSFKYHENGAIFFVATINDLGYPPDDQYHKRYKLTIYARVSTPNRMISFRLNKAILNRPASGSTEFYLPPNYAYESIRLFDESELIGNVVNQISMSYIPLNTYGSITWSSVQIESNNRHTVKVTASNVKYGSVITFSFNKHLPLGIVTGATGYNVDTQEIFIDLYNVTGQTLTLDAMNVSWIVNNAFS